LKKVKSLVSILFTMLLCFVILGTPASALTDQTIKIAGDVTYPPYEFVDENGLYKGFNVDIMRAVSIELGIDIEIVPMKWNEALKALQEEEVDVIQGMTRSSIREEKFSFSDPLIVNSQVIFVRKDTTGILSLKDLSGSRVSLQSGDVAEEIVKNIPSIDILMKDDQKQAIDALLSGEVDAFVGNRLTGLYLLQKNRKVNEIKIVGEPMNPTEYCAATLKGNINNIEMINTGIARIKENGTYDKIYKKWFGESFVDTSAYWKRLLIVSVIISMVGLGVILFVISWNTKLKEAVADRTAELAHANESLKVQQRKLEQSNRLRGNILENSVNGIIAFNSEGSVLTANASAEKILGRSISETSTWESLGLNEKLESDAFSTTLKGIVWRKNLEWNGQNGDKLYLNCNINPIKNPQGEVEGEMLLLHDYSKEKKYQDMLNHNEKMQTLGKIAAGVAHELRNPLTGIKAFVDLIPYKFDNPEFREHLMKTVPAEIQRLNSLVSVLLDYSKPKPPIIQKKKLEDVLREIVPLLSVQLKKKNIKLTTNCDGVEILADEQQLKQILINIFLNSIDAIDKNGQIYLECYKKENSTIIKIKDNGCGIPKEALEKVFDPFYTLKSTGYGIGLAICYQLMKENSGDISIDSKVGEGTTVTLYFNS
jgi:PAS domain S-box-containing protein